MITTIDALRAALRKKTYAGVVLYEGPSKIDGQPIVAIANRIEKNSTNGKTGAMVQTWIMRSDIAPTDALKSGDDSSVCGNCPHRPANNGSCYVLVFQAPRQTWKSYQEGRYARPGVDFDRALLPALFAGKAFRMGSYGDPTAVPFQIWRACTLNVAAINGYSHQWRDPRFSAFKLLCMASADNAQDMRDAHAMGWRTFRVRGATEALTKGVEVTCPASKEAGYRTSCIDCRACGGLSAKAKVSIAIMAHVSTANRFAIAA